MHWREKQRMAEEQILALVNISPEELFWLRVERAHHYLTYSRDHRDVKAYENTRLFWNWWLQIWTIIDEELIERLQGCDPGFRMSRETYAGFFYPPLIRFYPSREVRAAAFINRTLEAVNG